MRYLNLALAAFLVSASAYSQSETNRAKTSPSTPTPQRQSPRYPGFDLLYRISGTVTLLTLVGTDGRPRDIKVETSSGHRELDRAALEAVSTWSFTPETKNGLAVEGYIRTPINFSWPETLANAAPKNSSPIRYERDSTSIPYVSVDDALKKVSEIADYRRNSDSPDSALRSFGIKSNRDGAREMWFFADMNTDDAMVVRYTYTYTSEGITGRASALCKKGTAFCETRMPWILQGPYRSASL